MTTPHIHAALMAEYAKDALETDKPWKGWQHSDNGDNWLRCHNHPSWTATTHYRRKPVALCQVGGRDVFPGDRLWHTEWRRWVIAKHGSMSHRHVIAASEDGGQTQAVVLSYLSWTEPARTKTVYQWAFKFHDGWFMTEGFFETAEQAKHKSGDSSMDFRRLDWTALEVPA